jgi:hypothetical protein
MNPNDLPVSSLAPSSSRTDASEILPDDNCLPFSTPEEARRAIADAEMKTLDHLKPKTMSPFNESLFYTGVIEDQLVVMDRLQIMAISLITELDGVLVDVRYPSRGFIPHEKCMIDVRMRLDPNPRCAHVVKFSIRDLATLGLDSPEIERLLPDHPRHVSFQGKRIVVQPRFVTVGNYVNLYWNLKWPEDQVLRRLTAQEIRSHPDYGMVERVYDSLAVKNSFKSASRLRPTAELSGEPTERKRRRGKRVEETPDEGGLPPLDHSTPL